MRIPGEPLTKVTLNLYTKDVKWFKRRYKIGYTEQIREILRRHINVREGGDDDPEAYVDPPGED